jgi:hypothetical protein
VRPEDLVSASRFVNHILARTRDDWHQTDTFGDFLLFSILMCLTPCDGTHYLRRGCSFSRS